MAEHWEEEIDRFANTLKGVGRMVVGGLGFDAPSGGASKKKDEEIERLKKVVDNQLTDIADKAKTIAELRDKNRDLRAHVARLEGKDPTSGDS